MRILFVVPYVPNLIRVRPYQLIRSLAELGHEITLATLWTTAEERAGLQEMSAYCHPMVAHRLAPARALANCMAALFQPWPLQSVYSWQPALARDIHTLLTATPIEWPTCHGNNIEWPTCHGNNINRPFDVIHVEHLRGAKYGLAAKATLAARGLPIPVIWDSVDSITHLFQQARRHSRRLKSRVMTTLDLRRTQRYESWLTGQFARVLTTSADDRQALLDLTPAQGQTPPATIEVLPNGVDLAYFQPGRQPRDNASIVFTGKMSYHANITAALYLIQEIMPRVWAQRPDAHVWIVGQAPPREIAALDSGHNPDRRVTVTGTVPDIRPYLQRATMAAAPIVYGAGIQNKVLEAMACAAPVVTTPQAVRGLPAQPVQGVLVAPDATAFAGEILQLLDNEPARLALGQQGRAYVEQHHTWPEIASKLASIYAAAIQQPALAYDAASAIHGYAYAG